MCGARTLRRPRQRAPRRKIQQLLRRARQQRPSRLRHRRVAMLPATLPLARAGAQWRALLHGKSGESALSHRAAHAALAKATRRPLFQHQVQPISPQRPRPPHRVILQPQQPASPMTVPSSSAMDTFLYRATELWTRMGSQCTCAACRYFGPCGCLSITKLRLYNGWSMIGTSQLSGLPWASSIRVAMWRTRMATCRWLRRSWTQRLQRASM